MSSSTRSSRRAVLAALAGLPLGWRAPPVAAASTTPAPATSPTAASSAAAVDPAVAGGAPHAEFPRQDPARVRETVGAAHRDLERVRELVEASPALARANWDWGYGDWESALGAASHTGRREIAEYLLSRGARPTIFSAAMLGQLAVVRALLEAAPAYRAVPGPHGIPLVEHARAGGAAARPVLDYLESLPPLAAADPAAVQLPAAERSRYLGTFRYGAGERDLLEVIDKREALWIRRTGEFERGLTALGGHQFHPVGTPAVRVRFAIDGERATGLAVVDGGLVVEASRVDTVAGG